MNKSKRLIVGISGATGAIYGVRILEILSRMEDVETHLVLSKAGKMTIQVETPFSAKDVEAMADVVHDVNNVGASISSGSFRTEGMVIAPCSMKSMGGIAHSGRRFIGAGCRCRAERAQEARAGRTRDSASSRASRSDGGIDANGRGNFPSGAGLLSSSEDTGRRHKPNRHAYSRPVRYRREVISSLGR